MTRKITITHKLVKKLFVYSKTTGEIYWSNNAAVFPGVRGKETGKIYITRGGIISKIIQYQNRTYHASKIIYLMITGKYPKENIIYIDGDGANLRWKNLKLTFETVVRNGLGARTNTGISGYECVYHTDNPNPWQVVIPIKYSKILRYKDYIGSFKTIPEAVDARNEYLLNINIKLVPRKKVYEYNN